MRRVIEFVGVERVEEDSLAVAVVGELHEKVAAGGDGGGVEEGLLEQPEDDGLVVKDEIQLNVVCAGKV